jgi:hypothetical protein
VKGAKGGAADGKHHDFGTIGHGGVAPVSTHAQAVVENLARQTQTGLELAAANPGRLPGLPAGFSGNGTQSEPGATSLVGGEESAGATEGA